jgi:hypothetical protein
MSLVSECSEPSNILRSTCQRESNWLPIAFEIEGIVKIRINKKSQDPTDLLYLQVELTTSNNQQCQATCLARKLTFLVGRVLVNPTRHTVLRSMRSVLFSSAAILLIRSRWPTVQCNLTTIFSIEILLIRLFKARSRYGKQVTTSEYFLRRPLEFSLRGF